MTLIFVTQVQSTSLALILHLVYALRPFILCFMLQIGLVTILPNTKCILLVKSIPFTQKAVGLQDFIQTAHNSLKTKSQGFTKHRNPITCGNKILTTQTHILKKQDLHEVEIHRFVAFWTPRSWPGNLDWVYITHRCLHVVYQ